MGRDRRATYLVMSLFVTMLAFLAPRSRAQGQPTAPAGAADAEWRRQMEDRMKALEQENRELRKHLGEVAETQQAVIKDAQSRGLLTLEGGQPRLTTPDFFDVNKYVAEGDFPGSFLIPGTKTSLQIGGFVQLDAIVDSDRIGDKDAFVVSTIPTGDSRAGAGNTSFSIRQTRLFLKTQTPTKDWGNLVTYVEMDFFGTDGAEPRIRHAYGQIGDKFQLLAGQTWSAFQDATVFPSTLDFQGPAGIITSRRPQVRLRQEWDKRWTSVISIEDPKSDVTTPSGFVGEKSTPYPDLDANVRWTPDWGHLQLSGVLRYLQIDPDDGPRESALGYGLSLTGSVKTFRIDDKHVDSLLFQAAAGNGIARYINDTSGLGLDAVLSTSGNDLDGLDTFAGMIAYQHWWHRKWASTVGYSIVTIDNSDSEPGSDYHSGQYGVLNLRYYPAERVMLGVELLYGVREDKDGSSGDDLRVQFSAQYRF
jgi:DcaP outer membrane protein